MVESSVWLITSLSERRDGSGRAAVVRNGYQPERDIQTGIGPVTVKVPNVRSRDGNPVSFRSARSLSGSDPGAASRA